MSSAETNAILLSIQVALAAVLISLPLAVVVGWLLARKSFRGRFLVDTLVNLPLVLPPVVTGYLLLVSFGRNGFAGRFLQQAFGIRIVFDWKGAALAAAVISFPLMVRAIEVAFRSVDAKLERAARTLGAGRWRTFFTITLPLGWHGIVAGAVLAFARCLGEFGATIMIAGNIAGSTQTIPLYIYEQFETPGGLENSTGILVASVLIAAAALILSQWLIGRGAGGQSR